MNIAFLNIFKIDVSRPPLLKPKKKHFKSCYQHTNFSQCYLEVTLNFPLKHSEFALATKHLKLKILAILYIYS